MYMRRDFDLNSVGDYTDSSHKDVFRKTMVTQEIIFQNQVHELHRIYGTQRTLMMQNDNWMEFDRYNSDNKVGLAQSNNRQEFIGEFYNAGHQESLKLSLSVGEKNNRSQRGKRTWFDVNLSCEVIDLEDSTETVANDDTGPEEHSSARPDLPADSTTNQESLKSIVTHPVDQDVERFNLCDLNETLSPKNQQRSSGAMFDLDLNKEYCDDSSCQSYDPLIAHPSTTSSSDELVDLDERNCSPVSSKENYPLSDESHISDKVVIGPEVDGCVESPDEKEKSEDDMSSERSEPEKVDVLVLEYDMSSERSKPEKVDVLVLEAAELLVQMISFESSDHQRDCYEETETSQLSSDSFELFTLGLKECKEDDMCVSSKLSETDVAESKGYGLKIRRGRRLKDFQRDILPGMASLSRHEIREDINILEGVLRSREYKKMQAKMADDGHGWCVATRSRRSRLSCAKRRRFS